MLVVWEIDSIDAGGEFGCDICQWSVHAPNVFEFEDVELIDYASLTQREECEYIPSFQEFFKTLKKHLAQNGINI